MTRMLTWSLLIVLLGAISLAQDLPQRFTAFAVSTGGPRTDAVASRVEISISRWSSDDEAARLMNVLKETGPEALLEKLRDMKSVGTIQTPGNLAYDLRFAQQERGADGGRRILLATDRQMSYWEAVNRPRTVDYPFTYIELRINGDGQGEGKLALATKLNISSDGKAIELVNYDQQPIALNQVKLTER